MIPIPRRSLATLLRTLSACATLSVALHAAEPVRKAYDVPAADATTAFRTFSEVSGRELLYPADAVRGVRTKAVKGELTDLEALDAMLAGTGLVASVDGATGALAVRREDAAKKAAATPSPAEVAATAGNTANAGARASVNDDGAMELSPFEVNSDRDDGFMATNAGTATKLGLDMKDMPAPYSVITKEFIDALNLTSLNDVGSWSTNGGVTYDGQGSDIFGSSTQFSMRGEPVNGGMQRNFFLTAGLSDTYNAERVDFGRGPNAVLFNVGANTALGGGVSTQTKQARVDRTMGEVAVTVGTWDYYRSTFDYNLRVSPRLGLRVNAVLQTKEGYMEREADDRQGMTLAAKFRLTPVTELRAEVQKDRTERSLPTIQFIENMSGWDGKTVFNAPITNNVYGLTTGVPGAPNGLGQTLTYRGEVQGVERQGGISSTPYYVAVPGSDTIMNWQNMGVTRRADGTARTPVYSDGQLWSRNGDNNLRQWISGNPMFAYNIGIPEDWLTRALANSKFTLPGKRATFMVDAPVLTETTDNVTLGFTHQVGKTLFFEVAGAVDEVHQKINSSALGFRGVGLDINQTLPDGSPNPNYLQGYSDAGIAYRNIYTDNSGVRASVAYKVDAGKWGDYVFNLSGNYGDRHRWERNYNLSMAQNADPRQWQGGEEQLKRRFYYSEGSPRPYDDGIPTSVRLTTWAADGNSSTSTTKAVTPKWVLNNWNDRKETTEAVVLAAAGKYFKERLAVTAGARFDHFTTKVRDRRVNFADLPNDPNWDGSTLTDAYWRPDAPADWKQLSYIPLNANGTPRTGIPIPAATRPRTGPNQNNFQAANPLYANDRFRNDYNNPENDATGVKTTYGAVYHLFNWLSFKANYGDSYRPADTGLFTLDGFQAEAQTGKAWDGRINFSLFRGRLDIGLGYYYNLLNFSTVDPPIKGSINSLLGRNAATDGTPEGRNAFGLPEIIGTDYQSRDNQGFEVEFTGRITKGWRVFGNIGTAKSTTFKRYPQMPGFLAANAQDYLDVLQDAGGMLNTSAKPVGAPLAPGIAVANPAITPAITGERDGAINDYNNIWINYSNALAQPDTVGFSRLRLNFVTDYTVQTGPLKELRLGVGLQYASRNRAGDRGADLVPNPTYNPAIPTSPTNLPYRDNPDVNGTTNVWVDQPINTYLTFGYTLRLGRKLGFFAVKDVEFQLLVNNPLNQQMVVYQDGTALRPANADLTTQYWETVPNRIGQYQAPINVQFTTRIRF